MPKEQYMCQLCANHGIFNQPKKGHKQKCPFKNCLCNSCGLNTKRRALDQIERKLRVKKSPSPTVLENQTPPSAPTPTIASYINPLFSGSSETSQDIISNTPPSQSTYQSTFSSLQSTNTSSLINFSIPLPPTVQLFPSNNIKTNLEFLEKFKDDKMNDNDDNDNNEILKTNHLPYILPNKDEIENINKERRSIFHSVEMLTKEET